MQPLYCIFIQYNEWVFGFNVLMVQGDNGCTFLTIFEGGWLFYVIKSAIDDCCLANLPSQMV